VDILSVFGLRPFGKAMRDLRRALVGNPYLPPNQFGISSLKILKPQISLPTWLGRTRSDRRTPIYNFFNRVPAPKTEGYSVKVTFARDFMGGDWTYDGHLGTDFAVPVGTTVVAAAPGRVLRVENDMDHGGLKVCIDHGEGLFTTSNHLSRALVAVGDVVSRGHAIALSGASGIEFVLFFPWVSPHLHFNVWLDGEPIDPYALEHEESLWRHRNDPVPHDLHDARANDSFRETMWDVDGVRDAIDACRDPEVRRRLHAIDDLARRACEVLLLRNYRQALFTAFPALAPGKHPRTPTLDLPFLSRDFVGAAFP